jgi:hypothetical protein
MFKYFINVTSDSEVLGLFMHDDDASTLSENIPDHYVDVTPLLSMTHDEVMHVLSNRSHDEKLYFKNGRFFNKDEFSFLPPA